jgi:TniQ
MTQSEQNRGPKGEVFIQSRRLVARSSPEADESLYGWALRLAEANGYAGARAILSLANPRAPSFQGNLQNRLAQLVDSSPGDFERYVATKARGAPYHGLDLGLGPLYFDARPTICPVCLADRAVLKISVEFKNLAVLPATFLQIASGIPLLLQSSC